MRFVFFLQHPGFLRFFAPVVRELGARGHEVRLAFGRDEKGEGDLRLAEELGVPFERAPERDDRWRPVAGAIRSLADVARYGDRRFEHAPKLRARVVATVGRRLGPVARLAVHAPWLVPALERAERLVPPARSVDAWLREAQPDAVLVSPLVDFGSTQVEPVKSGRALGIPTGILVASWDNLTGKGLLRIAPDRVFVWNELQRREAVELHRMPAERVVATGAPKFDEWFEREPSTTPAEFAARVGLREPHLLYLCSSPFIAPDEVPFVRDWLDALRAHGRTDPVLVRPHPQNAAQWQGVDLSEHGAVSVWPLHGGQPDAEEARAGFYDSLAHATAVVGVNTSALIEAAIVGKRVFTILDPRFAETQEGTLHFDYLRGFLRVARSFDEHLAQLDEPDEPERTRAFVESFVRPRGLDRRATDVLADELEALARLRR